MPVAKIRKCMLDPNGIVTNWNTGAERIYTERELAMIGR